MTPTRVLADRPHLWAFIAGCLAVTAGVLLHLPMYWMGRHTGFRLAEMPMDAEMLWGMGHSSSSASASQRWDCGRAASPRQPARRTTWRSARPRTHRSGPRIAA
jgi:hypothetical protein